MTAIPPQNIGITPLMICYIFFRSVAQMTSDGTKQGENVKFELVPAFVFFPLESHNDPVTFLTVSF